MNSVDKAIQTQLTNIQAKAGQTLEQLRAVLQRSGLAKHGEIRAMFQRDLRLGYGDANMLTRALLESDAESSTGVVADRGPVGLVHNNRVGVEVRQDVPA